MPAALWQWGNNDDDDDNNNNNKVDWPLLYNCIVIIIVLLAVCATCMWNRFAILWCFEQWKFQGKTTFDSSVIEQHILTINSRKVSVQCVSQWIFLESFCYAFPDIFFTNYYFVTVRVNKTLCFSICSAQFHFGDIRLINFFTAGYLFILFIVLWKSYT